MGEALGNGVVEDVLEDFSEPVVGLVVVFAIPLDPHFADRTPLLQLPYTRAGTALADAQGLLHVIQSPRLLAEVEIGVDLTDNPAQAEGLGHVASVGDEGFDYSIHYRNSFEQRGNEDS